MRKYFSARLKMQINNNNVELLESMKETIHDYQNGKIPIQALQTTLDYLITAIDTSDGEWKQACLNELGDANRASSPTQDQYIGRLKALVRKISRGLSSK